MPHDARDDEIATSVATGASPIHHSTQQQDRPDGSDLNSGSRALEAYVRSRSLVPTKWSENENYQMGVRFFGAGAASMVSAVVTNPFDIIKVRQQLETEGSKSIFATARRMITSEGFKSLMNGTSASVAREGSYSMIRIGTYEGFKDLLKDNLGRVFDPDGIALKVSASIIAGTLGSALANPTDLVKIRMQAHYPQGSPFRSMRHAFSTIYNEPPHNNSSSSSSRASPTLKPPLPKGGLINLYRGVVPTVVRGWSVAACQMPAYDHTKQWLKRREIVREGLGAHLSASLFAGLVVSLASNPVDVIKVRIMNDTANRYRGVLHCVAEVLRHESPLAFYKGFGMCWARLGTHTVVTYMVYEQLRLMAGVKPL